MDINLIRKWVSGGENDRLEFKLKANHPEKIIREMAALANTRGGHLILGVSDDLKIMGVKYPEEAQYQIDTALERYCRPALKTELFTVTTRDHKKLLVYSIPKSEHAPHGIITPSGEFKVYFRVGEHSIQASPELRRILRHNASPKNTSFTYGEVEHKLMKLLEEEQTLTVNSFARKAGISNKKAADTLVVMVLANVIQIHPSDSGDKFSMAPVSATLTPQPYIN